MKHNWIVTGALIVAWLVMLGMIFEAHWRPAKLLMPVIGFMLFAYLVACTVYVIWGKPKQDADSDKCQSSAGEKKDGPEKKEENKDAVV